MEVFQTFGAVMGIAAFVLALVVGWDNAWRGRDGGDDAKDALRELERQATEWNEALVLWRETIRDLKQRVEVLEKSALAARIAVLECAAKGHGKTRVTRTEALAWHLPTGAVVDYYTATSASAPDDWRLADAVHVVITCLDCGAVLSDEWEPKEATDDPA